MTLTTHDLLGIFVIGVFSTFFGCLLFAVIGECLFGDDDDDDSPGWGF